MNEGFLTCHKQRRLGLRNLTIEDDYGIYIALHEVKIKDTTVRFEIMR